jgi:hypothetical protein
MAPSVLLTVCVGNVREVAGPEVAELAAVLTELWRASHPSIGEATPIIAAQRMS